jgi:hypothetical protein
LHSKTTSSFSHARAIVGDVEEVEDFVEQPHFALLVRDVLADHRHAIRLPAFRRAIIELGQLFALQAERLELALAHHPLLDVFGLRPRRGFHLVFRRTFELFPVPPPDVQPGVLQGIDVAYAFTAQSGTGPFFGGKTYFADSR